MWKEGQINLLRSKTLMKIFGPRVGVREECGAYCELYRILKVSGTEFVSITNIYQSRFTCMHSLQRILDKNTLIVSLINDIDQPIWPQIQFS